MNQVIPLAFVTKINGLGGMPETNYANGGMNCTGSFPGTNLWDCSGPNAIGFVYFLIY